jgi:hypothetical protein
MTTANLRNSAIICVRFRHELSLLNSLIRSCCALRRCLAFRSPASLQSRRAALRAM